MSSAPTKTGRPAIKPDQPINNLREVRERAGKTISDLAIFLGVADATVTQAEIVRTSALGKANWYRLADYFGLDPRVLEGLLPIPETFGEKS